jgi:tetratricopeptide (TPR) repeat protein
VAPGPRRARLAIVDVEAEVAIANLLPRLEELSARLRGPDGATALAELEATYPAMVELFQLSVDEAQANVALRLTNAMYRYWINQKQFEEGGRWFDQALALPGGDDRLRGEASVLAGFMPFWQGNDDRAAALFHDGLAIGRRLGVSTMIAQALGGLARVALRTDVSEGRRLAREALEVSEAAGDEPGKSNALHLLGVGAQIAGDLAEAREWMTQRLEIERGGTNAFLVASEASNLSMVERQLGNLDTAEDLAREALEISERIGEEFTKPFAIAGLAAIALERRQFERAATLIGAAEAMLDAKAMAWPPDEAPHHDRLLADLPNAIGSEAFDRARMAGSGMTARGAVRYALE